MEKLIEQLKEQTQDLKVAYIKQTGDWAAKEFDKLFELTLKEVLEAKGYRDFEYAKGEYRHTKASYAYWNKVQNIRYAGKEKHIAKALKLAEEHYEFSIEKLAYRIIQKGLDVSTVTLLTESDMEKGNISTTIKDATGKVVKAWTILAWGEINAPHYRYLIK